MALTYEGAAGQITLDRAVYLYEKGIATIVNDGKDLTFEVEEGESIND